jgi:hypothetical protein
MVVEEGDQVDAAVLPLEDKHEQVGLPQLIGGGALDVAGRRFMAGVDGAVFQRGAGIA